MKHSDHISSLLSRHLVLAVLGFAACMVAYFARFGYDFGGSDQDELIPAVYRVLSNNVLFSNDWFVSQQTAEFGVRTVTIEILAALSRVVDTYTATAILYFASAAGVFSGIYRISMRVSESRSAPWLVCLFVLVIAKGFTLGANDVINSMFVPSMVAWAFTIWSVYFWFGGKPVVAGLLTGMAVPFQALVGLQAPLLIVTASVILYLWHRDRKHLLDASRYCVAFAVVASAPLFLLLTSSVGTANATAVGDPFFQILATIRAPHHFLPTAFPTQSIVRFFALFVAGSLALAMNPARKDRDSYVALLASVLLICSFAFVLTTIYPVTAVVKLQLFKLTVHAKLLLGVSVVTAAVGFVEWRTPARVLRVLTPAGPIILLVLVFFFEWSQADGTTGERSKSDWGLVEEWVEKDTPVGSVFLVPPSSSYFRSFAKRAIVVSYKATPFDAVNLTEWLRRIRLVTGDFEIVGGASVEELDDAYQNLSLAQLSRIAASTRSDYVITRKALDGLSTQFESGQVFVYLRSTMTAHD